MRIKFLSAIASILFVSIAITACLDSNNTYEYSSDATIHAFGIDTIHGKYYKFTIDQLTRTIYNVDSLPVGSDTIIDRILIDTLSVTGIVTSGENDTIFQIRDSVDLRQPLKLKVHATDGITTREYTIKVNVHKQDPDSLVWVNMEQPLPNTPIEQQKSVILNGNQLLVFTSYDDVYQATTDISPFQWQHQTVTGLPTDIKLSSITNFQEKLYIVTESGKTFSSSNGLTWQEVSTLGMQTVTLVTSFPDKLIGIQNVNGENYFCTSSDGLVWTYKEENEYKVSPNFPINDIYSTVFTTKNGVEKAVVVGNTTNEGTATVPWFSMDGASWTSLDTPDTYCPKMENPCIMYYGEAFYIMGGEFNAIYKSLAGIAWYETKTKFLLPKAMKENNAYSMAIDKNNYIWIIIGQQNSVWRGRLNRLGFKNQ
ncbi:MAG: DUF6242 domain-containing protein [Bacteroides sp.]|jgi:hypothetical protein|nr:DUF6242 domain-containing protein [Bacteroides sp.]